MKATPINEEDLCIDFSENFMSTRSIADKYHMGEVRVKRILADHGLSVATRRRPLLSDTFIVKDPNTPKYEPIEGEHYIVYDEQTDFETKDLYNRGGCILTYLRKQYGLTIPSLLERTKYYQQTGNYWWEQWLKVKSVKNAPVRKCPYCDWETEDIDNRSGAFTTHLLNVHGITKLQHLENHPEDKEFLSMADPSQQLQLETNESKFIVCRICGKKVKRLSSHLRNTHNMTVAEYLKLYPDAPTLSDDYYKTAKQAAEIMNNVIGGRGGSKFTSKPEAEIKEYIRDHGIECDKNRAILKGKELDIFVPSYNIAIEFNGVKWHTEAFGHKDNKYHVDKLQDCINENVRLLTVFSDEYAAHPQSVLSKISQVLCLTENFRRFKDDEIFIRGISPANAADFIKHNDVFPFLPCTKAVAAYNNREMLGVMTLVCKEEGIWEIVNVNFKDFIVAENIAKKMFEFFVDKNYPKKVVALADRRWYDEHDNWFGLSGFVFDGYVEPMAWYAPNNQGHDTRLHPLTNPFVDEDCDRIWDCGYIRYIFTGTKSKIRDFNKDSRKEAFIKQAKAIEGNECIAYSQVEYVNSKTPVKLIDHSLRPDGTEYGEFWQTPNNHLKGRKHPDKYKDSRIDKQQDMQEEIIARFKEVHKGEKMDYSQVEYKGMHVKVKIICRELDINGNEYGEFWQEPSAHLKGCNHPRMANDKRITRFDFKKSEEIHETNKTPYINEIVKFVSKYDPDIERNYSLNEKYGNIDIYIPSKKIGIMLDGLASSCDGIMFDRNYHTKQINYCNGNEITLVRIFEDEYINHKDIILKKLQHALGGNFNLPSIRGHKCRIEAIPNAQRFLNNFHIQGYVKATVHLGAFYNDQLVGVMSFLERYPKEWELVRFATDWNYRCVGVGGKLFKYFTKNYQYREIKSFLDRRWCFNAEENLYTKLGFTNDGVTKPDYSYTDGHSVRLHKFGFRKHILLKKYPDKLHKDMTENEMTKVLGYYRIWNCGLIRYVYKNPEHQQ